MSMEVIIKTAYGEAFKSRVYVIADIFQAIGEHFNVSTDELHIAGLETISKTNYVSSHFNNGDTVTVVTLGTDV